LIADRRSPPVFFINTAPLRVIMADRTSFGKLKEVIQPPNLIEIQINSYLEFLQKEVSISQRKPVGLEAVFREVFPIQSYDERLTLEYVSYTIGEPKSSELECYRSLAFCANPPTAFQDALPLPCCS
jgi:DNA-directed RNA polymerase beta subunit